MKYHIIIYSILLSLHSISSHAMKRDIERELHDPRALKKCSTESNELNRKKTKSPKTNARAHSMPVITELPRPKERALRAVHNDHARAEQNAALTNFGEIYNEFYRQYKQAVDEDGTLPNQFFVQLKYTKTLIPQNLSKLHRAFALLKKQAKPYRALPIVQAPARNDGEDLPATLPLDDMDIDAQED